MELWCKACNTYESDQWWSLKRYYGFTGLFCSDCYSKISHDSWGRPRYPEEHLMMLLKLGVDTQVN
jgi:hypothetical protein